jgi:hypothetical protein
MFVSVVAVLCSLSGPACVEEIVTDSSLDDSVTMQSCLMIGEAAIVKWMNEHPIYHANWRLDRFKCSPGKYEIKGKV